MLTTIQLARELKRTGAVVNPYWTAKAARKTGLPISLAVALLHQESGGGKNEWGHDPTIFIGGGRYGPLVSRQAYLKYRSQRGPTGRGGMQGVGPCQLTYYSYQDEADGLGGCWKPYPNMVVGFRLLVHNIQRYGLRAGVAAYNGSGPAADRYSESVLALEREWAKRLGLRSIQA